MSDWIPAPLRDAAASAGLTIVLAWLGRMMWHVRQVQLGDRPFFGRELWLELPMAVCIAFVADGVAEYFGLHGKPAMAAVIIIAYLGPRGIEAWLCRLARRIDTPPKL